MEKQIPGYPEYFATDSGEIISYKRGYRKVLSATFNSGRNPYLGVTLYINGKKNVEKVHRLICLAFYGESPPDKPCACHKDDNRVNNKANNLYWGSYSDNMKDAVINGRQKSTKGETHPSSKLTEKEIIEIRSRYFKEKISQRKLAQEYKIARSLVSRIVRKESWKHI